MIAANAAIDAVGSSDANAATVARAIARMSEQETSSAPSEALMLDIPAIVERHGGLDGFFNAGNKGKTIAVPFQKLQTVLAGGFRPGQLVTIGARPRSGEKRACGTACLARGGERQSNRVLQLGNVFARIAPPCREWACRGSPSGNPPE